MRVYHPKLGRFMQTDPIGYKDNMNMYAYVGNDPVNAVDPAGEATVYIWNKGPTPTGNSAAGHVATKTKDGTYVSKFPTSTDSWSSKADFHTPERDVATYGRKADSIIEVDLPNEDAASEAAGKITSDSEQEWSPTNNCADAVESVLNSGGQETDHNDPINTPQNLKEEIQPPEIPQPELMRR
ncbi:MAG: RHS repeat-associated core domain-containing protein [Marinagarivorans sp.]|nr:RHS repeat-associated core domain-containing protein [Marinagarivorans sp.]